MRCREDIIDVEQKQKRYDGECEMVELVRLTRTHQELQQCSDPAHSYETGIKMMTSFKQKEDQIEGSLFLRNKLSIQLSRPPTAPLSHLNCHRPPSVTHLLVSINASKRIIQQNKRATTERERAWPTEAQVIYLKTRPD